MSIKKLSFMLLSAISMAALLNGCGSSSKEGSVAGTPKVADEGVCIVCHSTSNDTASGTNITAEYATSAHNKAAGGPGCEGCHGGGSQHNGIGPLPYPNPLASNPPQCLNAACHGDASSNIPGVVATTGAALDFAGQCSHCHVTTGKGSVHGAQVTANVLTAQGTDDADCVYCHNVAAPQHGTTLVNDNNGVRAIVPEFQKNSHHIVNANGALPTKAHCAVCHAEGTVGPDGSSIVLSPLHMKDGNIYLRNGNTALGQTPDKSTSVATLSGNVSVYAWNPTTPDHTLMDQFCFSCHNASGAATTYATLGNGINDKYLGTSSSPTNPFGDTISNGYDQMSRSNVVNVYDAFAPTNTSHHAVRAQKYSGRTRATVSKPSVFTQYSGAANNPLNSGANTNGNVGIGPLSPGSRYTIYEAGFFVSNYTPLGATKTVADDSTLHCGDCHTVGQWMPNSTTAVTSNLDGTTNVVKTLGAIGAHGSANEYMLRRSDGADALHLQATTNGSSLTQQTVGGTYVCFLCHNQGVYGEEEYILFKANRAGGVNSGVGGHGGVHPCNDATNGESAGLTGAARVTLHMDGEWGGGNLFGYTCAHCHNSGNKGFGGIHGNLTAFGNKGAWGNYSASAGWANTGAASVPTKTYRPAYRFMGGLSMRYNGGGSASKWESQVLQKSNREGCYNFSVNAKATAGSVPVPLTADKNEWVADGVAGSTVTVNGITSALNVVNGANNAEFTDAANGSQTFGTWGACSHHNGSSTTGSNASSLRKVQRPLTY